MKLKQILGEVYSTLTRTSRMQDELYWAQIYNNTTTSSSWLIENNFSPGRWAVGYSFLYSMYRVLNEMRPKNILELGMGQTTKMIGQYAAYFPDVKHIVIEQDKDWINFFTGGVVQLPTNSKIIQHDYEFISHKSHDNICVFANFTEHIQNEKFDFICIDAPIGSRIYSRIDILKLLPQCLEKSFVLMLDDYNRVGEQNTINEITNCLNENNMPYSKGIYHGEKDMIIISSSDNKFFCSM